MSIRLQHSFSQAMSRADTLYVNKLPNVLYFTAFQLTLDVQGVDTLWINKLPNVLYFAAFQLTDDVQSPQFEPTNFQINCILLHSSSQTTSKVAAFCTDMFSNLLCFTAFQRTDDVQSWYFLNQRTFKRVVFYSIPAHRRHPKMICNWTNKLSNALYFTAFQLTDDV